MYVKQQELNLMGSLIEIIESMQEITKMPENYSTVKSEAEALKYKMLRQRKRDLKTQNQRRKK